MTATQRSEQPLTALLSSIPGVVYQLRLQADGSKQFIYVSPSCQEVCELSPATLQQEADQLYQRLHPADRNRIEQAIAQATAETRSWSWQGRLCLPSGQIKWIQDQAQPARQANGEHLWSGLLLECPEPEQGQIEPVNGSPIPSQSPEFHSLLRQQDRESTGQTTIEVALRQSEQQLRQQQQQLARALQQLQQTQLQLIQTEKMSSLGRLMAGIAHEINNPITFIHGNLVHADQYAQDLLNLLHLYQLEHPQPSLQIQRTIEAIDLDFLVEDFPKLLSSINVGADRIRRLVLSLRNFSRLDEAAMKPVDLHKGIESTLLILQNHLKPTPEHPGIEICKCYGDLPQVECYASQLNQVFMNILTNAIDALRSQDQPQVGSPFQSRSTIRVSTEAPNPESVVIRIADNGPGIPENIQQRLFDPFFTTKPVGQGTGLGLSICYQIVVERHGGQLQCLSSPGQGTEFIIELPVRRSGPLTWLPSQQPDPRADRVSSDNP